MFRYGININCRSEPISFNHVCRSVVLQDRTSKLILRVDPRNAPPMPKLVKVIKQYMSSRVYISIYDPYLMTQITGN